MKAKKDNVIPFDKSKKMIASSLNNFNVSISSTDWQKGFNAGLAGICQVPVPMGLDEYSWFSGWIEGDSKRQERIDD